MLALPFLAIAQAIDPLPQFTSTTSPTSAIVQRTFGKAFRLTGQSSGCAQFSSNGTLTSTGSGCASSGGTPGAPIHAIQYNNPLGTFVGDANFIRDITDPTNRYGVKIGDVSGATNNWNIYSGSDYSTLNSDSQFYVGQSRNAHVTVDPATQAYENLGLIQDSGTSDILAASQGTAISSNNTGTRGIASGIQGDAVHDGLGTVNNLIGASGYAEVDAGTAVNAISLRAFSVVSGAGLTTNDIGLFVDDQTAGANNWAIKTGLGQVQLGALAGTGTRVVTANTNGVLGTSSIALSGYPFPLTGNATSTLTQFNGGLTAYASSTISALTVTNATTTGQMAFGTGTAFTGINAALPNSLDFWTNGSWRGGFTSGGSLVVGTTTADSLVNLQATAQSGRESLLKARVSDTLASNSSFFVYNGSATDGAFTPSFGGINETSPAAATLQFNGFVTSSSDTSNSAPLVRFLAQRTSNAADPINGTLTAVANRNMFEFSGRDGSSNIVPYAVIDASGRLGLSTSTPNATLWVNGSKGSSATTTAISITLATTTNYLRVTDTSAARTITLPNCNATILGNEYTIKDASGLALVNNITVQRVGTDLIDGATTNVINTNYASRMYKCAAVNAWDVN